MVAELWNLGRPNVSASKLASSVVFCMTAEERETMGARWAESCPAFSKGMPDDPMSEGKPRVFLVRACLISLPQPAVGTWDSSRVHWDS